MMTTKSWTYHYTSWVIRSQITLHAIFWYPTTSRTLRIFPVFYIDWTILERPIDLSSLLYQDSLISKLVYGFTLFCSFSLVGISCARILKYGDPPVIDTFVSFKFLKIILLIVTRFLVQSYVLAMAVKSLMYWFVSHNQFFKPGQSSQMYKQIENLYYRGLCLPDCRADRTHPWLPLFLHQKQNR